MKLRTTHTVVELPLSPAAYAEIASKLRDAGYDHCFGIGNDEGLIDMTGIGVRAVHKRESAVSTDEPNDIGLKDELIEELTVEKERLYGLINSPQIESFDEAVKLEAAHQIVRWGSDHDAGKTDVDFLFLIGFLGGKAVEAGKILEKAVTPVFRQQLTERRLHHIIAAAAAARNWHLQRIGGDKRMRPGILRPQGFSEEEEQAFGLPTPERTPPMPPTESGARELRAEADRLGVDIPKEVSVAGVFTVEKGAAVVKGEPVDVVREFTSETEERAARLDAAAATGSVEHYTSVVESMIEEDEAKASLREGSTVRVPGVGEL